MPRAFDASFDAGDDPEWFDKEPAFISDVEAAALEPDAHRWCSRNWPPRLLRNKTFPRVLPGQRPDGVAHDELLQINQLEDDASGERADNSADDDGEDPS